MPEGIPNFTGLFASLRRMFDTVLAILQNRLELAALEWEEEKRRAVVVVLSSVAVLFCGFMSMLVITGFFLAAFWEHRVWVLGGFSILYLVGGVMAWRTVKREIQKPFFDETITQLQKDRKWLFPPS